ncbi:MAG: DUF6261 family protein [Tannerellaceae bacterium]|jgi:hypothetical protein|nr:DUF6261 family protein [Tannerellaceae bacterium]
MKILRVDTVRLRNEEWLQLHAEFFHLMLKCGAEELGVERMFRNYEPLYREAEGVMELLRRSFITADAAKANRLRVELFRGLRDAAGAYRRSLDGEKRLAAAKIDAVIKKYGKGILRGARSGITASIDGFLQEFTPGEGWLDLSAEALLLGLGEWIRDLEAVNTAYKTARKLRAEETASRPETGLLRKLRGEIDRMYRSMINVVDAVLLTVEVSAEGAGSGGEGDVRGASPEGSPGEVAVRFAKALNVYLSHYIMLLKGRRTRSGRGELPE